MLTSEELRQYPLLDAEQERDLARRYHAGDREAGQRFLLSNLRLIRLVIRRSCPHLPRLDDAFQEGYLGLQHALDKFDPELGFRFSTYAVNWVRRYVIRFAESEAKHLHMLSLDEPIVFDDDSEGEETRMDLLADEADICEATVSAELVRQCLSCLDDRRRRIIIARYGNDLTYKEIGRHYHFTDTRAKQLEQTALATMRAHLETVTA